MCLNLMCLLTLFDIYYFEMIVQHVSRLIAPVSFSAVLEH